MSRSAEVNCSTAGWTSSTSSIDRAMRIAVGTVSLDDCEALMWSLGCTPSPTAADASVDSTSLTFMFVDVPEPVWKMSIGKCSSSSPASTRRAASAIAAATSGVTPGTSRVALTTARGA